MAKHVAVLMGGWSSEREVSLRSGAGCAAALESVGYRVTQVDVGRDVAAVLAALKPDVALNALHGPFGEDGCLQGILEYLAIPYTHSGVLASALAMNKDKAKAVLAAAGVPVAQHRLAHRLDAAREHLMPAPYVIKPVSEGSSVGVFIVRAGMAHPPQELFAADWRHGDIVMVEKYVAGQELTCAVINGEATGVIDIQPVGQAFYDYDSKYLPGASRHVLPAEIKPNIYQEVRTLAVRAHHALGCKGVSRSDFRYDAERDDLVILEVNTQPGMTATSLVPELAAHAGIDFPALVSWMVEDASCNR